LKAINGNVENKPGFLNALYAINLRPRAQSNWIPDHDVVDDMLFEIVKNGDHTHKN
jgi:hypothetical protein